MTPWRSRVRGLLEAWYPRASRAVPRSPGSCRTLSIRAAGFRSCVPASRIRGPDRRHPSAYPGIANSETYKEGVFVGYRWYDEHRVAPAFPFGFGLSYTRFAYRGLRIRPTAGGAVASFTVQNVGRRPGAAVPADLGLPSLPGVPQLPAQLRAFGKVVLTGRASPPPPPPKKKKKNPSCVFGHGLRRSFGGEFPPSG